MKIVWVKFVGSSKMYAYVSKLDFIVGGMYDIVADNRTTYSNSVIIQDIKEYNGKYKEKFKARGINLREITSCNLVSAPPKPDGGVDKIICNDEKGATVILWKDGTKTMVKCRDNEVFDMEKGIALCFMKKAFDNRGCYNDAFKDIEEM